MTHTHQRTRSAAVLLCLALFALSGFGNASARSLRQQSTGRDGRTWDTADNGAQQPPAFITSATVQEEILANSNEIQSGVTFITPRGELTDQAPIDIASSEADYLFRADAAMFNKKYNIKTTTPNKKSSLHTNVASLATQGAPATKLAAATDSLLAAGQSGGNNLITAADALYTVGASPHPASNRNFGVTLANLAKKSPKQLSKVLAATNVYAANQPLTAQYADACGEAFKYADQQGALANFARGVADSILDSGVSGSAVWGEALADAIAGSPDTQQAVAKATATVMCEGGARAEAWASAMSVTISQNAEGCLVLNEAYASAYAVCEGRVAKTYTESKSVSTILGFCGLPVGWFDPQNWSSADSSTNSQAGGPNGGRGNANASGSATSLPPVFDDWTWGSDPWADQDPWQGQDQEQWQDQDPWQGQGQDQAPGQTRPRVIQTDPQGRSVVAVPL